MISNFNKTTTTTATTKTTTRTTITMIIIKQEKFSKYSSTERKMAVVSYMCISAFTFLHIEHACSFRFTKMQKDSIGLYTFNPVLAVTRFCSQMAREK